MSAAGPGTFTMVKRPLADHGNPVLQGEATCCRCGGRDYVTLNGNTVGSAAKLFKTRGWALGRRGASADVCPKCVKAKRPKPSRPAPQPETQTALAELLQPVATAMAAQPEPANQEENELPAQPDIEAVTPLEVRRPTKADSRRILDALHEHYDEDGGHYRQSFSDQSLAAKLNVPRRWVSDVREQFFGEDRNEAALEAQRRLLDTLAEAERTRDRLMEMAAEADQLASNLRAKMGVAA